ncbi:MAG: phosphatase PAP2 family protein [Methylotenera sp.]|jgi:membrane-associated PAP2 superfamily phosphatase|nr:phosphatase PAP2 family protein [Methylotenera sp.]
MDTPLDATGDRPTRFSAAARSLLAVAAGLVVLLAWDTSGLDLAAMRLVGGPEGFALREHWFTTQVIHQGGRALSWAVVGFILLANLWPRVLPALTRRERSAWLGITLLCLAVVSVVKRVSLTSCPWDLSEFGGSASYVSHWAFGLHDGGGGHCFPSGHASAAFAFLCGGWVLARAYPRLARAWLCGVIGLGVVYGLGQMVRGAHYPSHTMWTAWICWAVTVGSVVLLNVSRAPGK